MPEEQESQLPPQAFENWFSVEVKNRAHEFRVDPERLFGATIEDSAKYAGDPIMSHFFPASKYVAVTREYYKKEGYRFEDGSRVIVIPFNRVGDIRFHKSEDGPYELASASKNFMTENETTAGFSEDEFYLSLGFGESMLTFIYSSQGSLINIADSTLAVDRPKNRQGGWEVNPKNLPREALMKASVYSDFRFQVDPKTGRIVVTQLNQGVVEKKLSIPANIDRQAVVNGLVSEELLSEPYDSSPDKDKWMDADFKALFGIEELSWVN